MLTHGHFRAYQEVRCGDSNGRRGLLCLGIAYILLEPTAGCLRKAYTGIGGKAIRE